MGFIDYAWAVSLQKDNTKVKIIQDPQIRQPELYGDNVAEKQNCRRADDIEVIH